MNTQVVAQTEEMIDAALKEDGPVIYESVDEKEARDIMEFLGTQSSMDAFDLFGME